MIINKITTGYVVQKFDTDRNTFVSQGFISGDECTYESENGVPIGSVLMEDSKVNDAYLPFEMIQPMELN